MDSPFHAGERAVQDRVGVRALADQVGRIVGGAIPPAVRLFLQRQRLVILASADADGSIWASPLAGQPGFAHALDPHTVQIDAQLPTGDPVTASLHAGAPVGLLIIDLANRGRIRLNGRAAPQPDGTLQVQIDEAFGNCQKYIQVRIVNDASPAAPAGAATATGAPVPPSTALSDEQQRWIASADTFFIASAHPEGGADASHRGGPPGFVQVLDPRRLRFPDYAGNNMFQTLGNLEIDPRAGLVFVDFEAGRTLQVTGRTRVIWDGPEVERVPGAQRLLDLEITGVVELARPEFPRWRFVEYSPALPTEQTS
jgi:predicted pyridoxine 5'-phosphate oxidase superfamily flavin-nucleotide-binding protein